MVAELQHTAEDLAPITVDEAVYRTVLYADIFDFPLTRREVARRLVAPDGLTLPDQRSRCALSPSRRGAR